MNNFDITLLELVEHYATSEGLIDSEEALSELFDETIAPMVIEQYGADDEAAMSESFNDWADSLCKDNQLHSEQYSQYCYIGKHSTYSY